MRLFRTSFVFLALTLPLAGVQAKLPDSPAAKGSEPSWPPAPDFPTAQQTATWTAPTEVRTIERLPDNQAAFEKAINKILQQSPEKLGLPSGVALRVDSIQLVPEATEIPPMAFLHLTQKVGDTPVAGTDVSLVLQWTSNGSPIRYVGGRLYPDLKSLPEKAIPAEEAEQKVWTKLSGMITRFETAPGGTWVRWIDGRWRTVQLFGVTPQNLIAAVTGSGEVNVWPGRIVTPPPAKGDKK